MDWSEGIAKDKPKAFSKENYDDVYRKHISRLKLLEAKAPTAFAKLRTKLWEDASYVLDFYVLSHLQHSSDVSHPSSS